MLLHPAVQERAQVEIDKVVGSERLPNYSDRSSLPFVEAIMREILRWRPAVPAGDSSSLARISRIYLTPDTQCLGL